MIQEIFDVFDNLYPFTGKCFLNFSTPWQLLFATILSAQCTDDCVNAVTPKLFAQFPTLADFAAADIRQIEKAVYKTGFYRNKARHLQNSAQVLLANFGGEVPSDISALTSLPGVGRKTANVVRGHIFQIPSIVVDTHVMRVSKRLGLTRQSCPVKIEHELMDVLPKERWIAYNQQAISHGRAICTARKPNCENCPLAQLCN